MRNRARLRKRSSSSSGRARRSSPGGQSLIPSLNMRLSAPELLVDITGLAGFFNIEAKNGAVRIGALCTHAMVERLPEVREHAASCRSDAAHRAPCDPQPRHARRQPRARRPGRRVPACAVALDAFVIASKAGERRVRAVEFFKGLFETDLEQGEIVGAEFPKAEKPASWSSRRHGDYAIVGLAAVTKQRGAARLAFGFSDRPVLVKPRSLEEAKASCPRLRPTSTTPPRRSCTSRKFSSSAHGTDSTPP